MGAFSALKKDGLEETQDVLGGYQPLTTDVYDATIKVAYLGTSSRSSAQSVTIIASLANGQEYRETVWFTNGKGDNFYTDKQDSKKRHPLPGFTTVDDLCLLTTGHELSEQDTEEKVVKVYDRDERKEVNKTVDTIAGLTGQSVKLAIQRSIVDRTKQADNGEYVPTGETRMENTIEKVFHAETGRTVAEYRHEVDPAEFMPAWTERNQGKDRNRAKGTKGSGSGSSGSGRPSTPKSSLFA